MKYITIILEFLIVTNIYAASVLDKQVQLRTSPDDLRTVFTTILQQTGIPILYEGCPQKTTLVNIPKKKGSVKDVLGALCRTTYRWSLENGVLLFQDKKFIENPYYPVKKYRFDYQINTGDLEHFLEKTTFFDNLWKERINNWGIIFVYKFKKSFRKTYKNASLRDILLDILKDSNSFCFIYQYSPKDTAATYKIVRENKNIDDTQIKDSGKPLYGLIGRSYELLSPEFIPEKVLDGSKQLKCSFKSSHSSDNSIQIIVNLKNNSKSSLRFHNFKKESLILYEIAYKSNQLVAPIGEFLIYPPLKSEIPEKFTLKPLEERTFTFSLNGARYLKAPGAITIPGTENKYSYKPDKTQILKKPHKFSSLLLVIYFYDLKGNKYKTVSHEFIDIIQ